MKAKKALRKLGKAVAKKPTYPYKKTKKFAHN